MIPAEQSHYDDRTVKRYQQFSQIAEAKVVSSSLGTANQGRELGRRDVEVCFRASLAENFLNRDAVSSHDERTEAALGPLDNGFQQLLKHINLDYGRAPPCSPGLGIGEVGLGAVCCAGACCCCCCCCVGVLLCGLPSGTGCGIVTVRFPVPTTLVVGRP